MCPSLPTALYRAASVRELDRVAIEEFGIPGIELMERASAVAFDVLRGRWPEAQRIVVIAGAGNNAGDGFILARLAKLVGLDVRLLYLTAPEKLLGDARLAYQGMAAAGVVSESFKATSLAQADVLVDALLDTGLCRPVEGEWAAAIVAMNESPAPVLALDIPSGLHSDTGSILGVAVRAAATISFIGLKQGLYTGLAREYAGDILFSDLDVPAAIYKRVDADAHRLEFDTSRDALLPRPRATHKGNYGHVLIVGGELGYPGAAPLAAEAAARVGAGLVSVATRAAHVPVVSMLRPEVMAHGIESAAELIPLLKKATVVLAGPGLGQTPWARHLLSVVLEFRGPLVLDADALNLLAVMGTEAQNNWVLTPHPGEAARLLGSNTAVVQTDRFAAAHELVARYGGISVLKGSGTIVLKEKEPSRVCSDGNPGMASGGMGDVLGGTIAGLIAQGLNPWQAACTGVAIHARAGDLAAVSGERGLLARDLIPHLRTLINPST